eukprot:TRINITY_DN11529_c0_g1_i2.p1 TRINITY_DN11529_c0_g1~~TRINITY_DN11529_c0_g1_i2.p1  ORF type:complete len:433 (+),score=102.70 TRINITY_DN11529_c0_g1_i2:243-1541(+)
MQVTLHIPKHTKCLIAGGNSYVASLDSSSGKVLWKQGFEQGGGRGPVSLDSHEGRDTVYVASKGKVKALSLRTGDKVWSTPLVGTGYDVVSLCASPCGALFAATSGTVFRIAGGTGVPEWMTTLKSYSTAALHVSLTMGASTGQLFYGLHGRVGVVNVSTGKRGWTMNVAKLEHSPTVLALTSAVVEGTILTGEVDPELLFVHTAGVVMGVLPRNGGIVWERDVFHSKDVHYEQGALLFSKEHAKLFLASCSHCLALCPLTGAISWSSYVPRASCCLPNLVNLGGGLLMVAGGGGAVFLDAFDGQSSQAGQYLDVLSRCENSGNSIMGFSDSRLKPAGDSFPGAQVAAVIQTLTPGSNKEILSSGHASSWADHTASFPTDAGVKRLVNRTEELGLAPEGTEAECDSDDEVVTIEAVQIEDPAFHRNRSEARH